MAMKKQILIFFSFLLLLSPCQLDKRVYRNGYSLISDHNNKHQTEKPIIKHENICVDPPYEWEIKTSDISANNTLHTSDSTTKITKKESDTMFQGSNNTHYFSTEINAEDNKRPTCRIHQSFPGIYADNPPKTHWATIVSAGLAAVAIAGFLITGLSFPLSLISIIFGVIAINKTENNPNKYKNKAIAIIAVLLCSILFLLELLLIAFVLLFLI